MKLPIYLDCHATTPVDPRVFEAMTPYFTKAFGNPASRGHVLGWEAEAAVDAGRAQLAAAIGAAEREIVFTSGATESDNLAILGVARIHGEGRIVTALTEHPAVLDPCRQLEKEGFAVSYLTPDASGEVTPDRVREAMTDDTILVSLMIANNEIGTIQRIAEIGAICRERGVVFHSDAVQGFGKIPFDVEAMNLDLASISAHKIYGPKGVGALYVRSRHPRVRLQPVTFGGGQERGVRSGTLNVPGIVGLGLAAELAVAEMPEEARRLRRLRDRLHRAIASRLDDVTLNGPPPPRIEADGSLAPGAVERRLPANLNLSFGGVDGEALLVSMKDVAVSSGSACTSASLAPSHVLRAIGVPDALAHASIRFGLGRWTTEEEVDYAAGTVVRTVERLREGSPLLKTARN
ncbi:MAG TPA: aminotransferase class V-fold PLP-dependent enzyme [Thermoanaerobaculia bacterium]|jgi:cysteine desulfurase|nr:aminotransferase class V-fold PLP-dependent enzyme [Thermoanaerobaculia bacterium]